MSTLEEMAGGKASEFSVDVDIERWPGQMLLALRENLGYSQDHVATETGIPVERLADFENGTTPMPSEAISRAANFFGVLPSAFFKRVDWMGDVGQVLDRIAFDYEFEQMLCNLSPDQRLKLVNVAYLIFADEPL